MKNEHTSSTAPLLIGMAAGAALGAAGVMATNTSQRQMRRTARTGDDHADTARLGRLGILTQQIGRPVGAYDALFEIDTELFERGDGVGHHLVIAHRAHNHTDLHILWF